MYYTEVSKTFKSKSVKEAERLEGIDGFYERLLIQQNINSAIKKRALVKANHIQHLTVHRLTFMLIQNTS